MAFPAGVWINLLLLTTPSVLAATGTNVVPLPAQDLVLEGLQWRVDLLDGLHLVGQEGGASVWTANTAAPKRLVAASSFSTTGSASGGHPEPTWLDRLGRVLGTAWIVSLPFVLFLY